MRSTGSSVAALLLLLAVPCRGADAVPPPSLAGEVLEMLEAGLREEVIRDWLASGSGPAPAPTAAEMIALKQAGASDALLTALLARVRGEPPEPQRSETPRPEPGAGPPPSDAYPSGAGAGAVTERAARSAAEADAAAPDGDPQGALVTFRLAYSPRFDDADPEWDLFVYLDGKPLTYVPRSGSAGAGLLASGDELEFRRRLAPGRHLLRVTQERHERRRGGRWLHAARVADEAFAFDLSPGEPAEVELTFRQGWPGLGTSGPLAFEAVQGERVAEREGAGGDPEAWPALCEESEAGDAGREGCVGWSDLWEGLEVPDREEVRRALAAFEYRPVPKGS